MNLVWIISILIILIAAGCSNENNNLDVNESQEKGKIIFSDAGWDSNRIHNEIAAVIIENGYGHDTEVTMGSTPIVIEGLAQGDIDVSMEVWTDNFPELYYSGIDSGDIVELSVNFDDNAQGLYVPTYVIEGDPERGIEPIAPDLKSIKDLPKYWELFKDPDNPEKGRIYGSPPGWAVDEILRTKVETYGLDEYFEYFNPGSESALNTSMTSAIDRGEPWVGYNWEPTWIMGMYDMTLLEDEPYDEEKWANGFATEFPGIRVTVAANAGAAEKYPEVMDFLQNYRTSSDITNKLLAYMQEHDGDIEKTAEWFFVEYEDLWTEWVPGEIEEKVKGSLSADGGRLDSSILRFPEFFRIDLGYYVQVFVDWLTDNFGGFFDALTAGVNWIVSNIQSVLGIIPWFIFIPLIFLIGWKIKNWKSGLVYALMMFLIGTLGLWNEMIFTLSIVITSVIIAVIIGVPIGIFVAYNHRVDVIMKPVLDAMQTMPSFVYLIPAMIFFGLGTVPAVFATIIYSTPPCIRLTSLAIKEVPSEMKEAAHSFGSSTWQILTKVELPQALPTIMAGVNQTTMLAMSMVVISSMIGAKGLGENVLIAINRSDIAMGFNSGISIVFLAIIIDRITQIISKPNGSQS